MPRIERTMIIAIRGVAIWRANSWALYIGTIMTIDQGCPIAGWKYTIMRDPPGILCLYSNGCSPVCPIYFVIIMFGSGWMRMRPSSSRTIPISSLPIIASRLEEIG